MADEVKFQPEEISPELNSLAIELLLEHPFFPNILKTMFLRYVRKQQFATMSKEIL